MQPLAGVMGIDVGATLCKLALQQGGLRTARHTSTDLGAVQDSAVGWGPRRIGATGGGAATLGPTLAGAPVHLVPEFDAWAAGARLLAALEGIALPQRYLLVSLGTGTSVLAIGPGGATRAGGTALGGGTVLGLGRLLLGVQSFAAISRLASTGDRRSVDLLISDVYREARFTLPGDLTAASFAKLASNRPEDLAHALMGLVGENVALICNALARNGAAEGIVYCGSTLEENPVLVAILREITEVFGQRPLFLARGAFCGAVGAAALAAD
jgi:type II pantothenate kinase